MAGTENTRRTLRRGTPHAARGVVLLAMTGVLVVGGIGVAAAVTPRIIAAVHNTSSVAKSQTSAAAASSASTTTAATAANSVAEIATSVAAAAAPTTKKTSVPAGAAVGPLFLNGLSAAHTCTASVVNSPSGEVLVTAAHCLSGTATGVVFAPGYANGAAPYGTWTVTAAYVDPAWTATQNPADDYAFLVVTPTSSNPTRATVQSVVGGNTLSTAPASGTAVTVTGYATGTGSTPVVCTNAVTDTGTSPTFACQGYVGGTSGGPWVTDGTITGVIGGLHQGGCEEQISYTAPFNSTTAAVFARAAGRAAADTLPRAGSDGC